MIKYLDLKYINTLHQEELKDAFNRVLQSGIFLRGEETSIFEKEYANYIGSSYCIGCSSGLAALTLIFRAYIELGIMKEGDEILVPSNTYIASILSISSNHLKPVLVEPDIDTFQIDASKLEEAITSRTKGLLIVHLYGKNAYTDKIKEICQKYNLRLIEDNAQAHGCTYQGGHTGSFGEVAAHSFYPGKNLGALGDAGAITTNKYDLAQTVRMLGNYGSETKYVFKYIGSNSRIDEIQAAVLRVKLKYLDAENRRRVEIARTYIEKIKNPFIKIPCSNYLENNVFHVFPVLTKYRNNLQEFLSNKGIETLIHYPIPPHKQNCYKNWNNLKLPVTEYISQRELSIPISHVLTNIEIENIISSINTFNP